MKIQSQMRCVFFFFSVLFSCHAQEYDLTIVGRVINADGLCRIPITLIDMFNNDLKINHVQPFNFPIDTNEINEEVMNVLFDPDKTPGKVSLIVDGLWSINHATYTFVPQSKIKIAYSMFESNSIPKPWVEILNTNFDAVVVPDLYLVDSYRNAGVVIPIFELPICLNLSNFLAKERTVRPRNPFVFGCTASGLQHKNQILLIQAFAEEFGNQPNIVLRLSCRGIGAKTLEKWNNLVQTYGCNNIFFNVGVLDNNQYTEFMNSLDCYVNISKGEGFSIGPREALSLGIPSIISNNSAQKTICRNGLVRQVTSEIEEPPSSDYIYFGDNIGSFFNCRIEDVQEALRDVYDNYDIYLHHAQNGPAWASQYCAHNLKQKYINLIKPKKIILGNKNEITEDYLMTISEDLYYKYNSLYH